MTDVIFYAMFTAAKAGKAGLAVTVDVDAVHRTSGVITQIATGSPAAEVRNGLYKLLAVGLDLKTYDYLAVFKTADGTVDLQNVPSLWTSFGISDVAELARLDATITSRLAAASYTTPPTAAEISDRVWDDSSLGSGQIITVSPVATSGDVTTYQGDDYDNADGRALDWSTSDAGTWPDLSGATITVVIDRAAEFDGEVVTPSGATKKARLHLTGTETESIPEGVHAFRVLATYSNRTATLVNGRWTSRRALAGPAT